MTAATDRHAPPTEADVARLVLEHPFAWLVTQAEDDYAATPLPLRPVLDGSGRVTELLGHFARRNPHVALLRRQPRTLVLFMGPHGYVSSSWFSDRTRTPTWNYAAAQFLVEVELVEDAEATDEIVRDLVVGMEGGRPAAWSPAEMGPRYRRLVGGILAFRARVIARRVRFKLGQDERDQEYGEIAGALARSGESALLEWMERCNRDRSR